MRHLIVSTLLVASVVSSSSVFAAMTTQERTTFIRQCPNQMYETQAVCTCMAMQVQTAWVSYIWLGHWRMKVVRSCVVIAANTEDEETTLATSRVETIKWRIWKAPLEPNCDPSPSHSRESGNRRLDQPASDTPEDVTEIPAFAGMTWWVGTPYQYTRALGAMRCS